MPTIVEFALTVITISISGVMAPGPMFAANVAYGLKGGIKTGLKIACGHSIVEFPLVILIGLGSISLTTIPQFREIISILGAVFLFVFAAIQIRSIIKKPALVFEERHGPFLAGILLSGLNPFFFIWWFTIGFKLIADAIALYSMIGIGIMFVFHIWMDYAWLSLVAFLSSKGRKIIGNKSYRIFMLAISGILISFGIGFLLQEMH